LQENELYLPKVFTENVNSLIKERRLIMNVKDENCNKVIVRGINSSWFADNFKDMKVYFSGSNKAVPLYDTYYLGFYLEQPDSAITHIGIIKNIERTVDGSGNKTAIAYLSAIIKLPTPIKTDDAHPIRKHEYWSLDKFGLSQQYMEALRNVINVMS